jgi:hypothetical protein
MPNHPGLLGFLPGHEHVDLAQIGTENLEGHQYALGSDPVGAKNLIRGL